MRSNARKLSLVIAGLFVAQAALHISFLQPTWIKSYSPGKGLLAQGLGANEAFLQLLGFREFLAGILWVRGDTYFETGNYDAVLPIIRLVTILDPKNVDVYATGIWHVGYNFTDEEHRSDRRYIPSALALGKEGAENNPETYELFYETAWLWYHKIDDDYPQAVSWLEKALERKDMIPARRNLLFKALEKDGRPMDALDHLYAVQAEAYNSYKVQKDESARVNYDTITNNIDTTLIRLVQRGAIATKEGRYDKGDYDTKPPFDVGFSAKVTVIEPKVLRIEGTWNVLPVGTRIRVVLRDADQPNAIPGALAWDQLAQEVKLDPPKEMTFMQEQLFVRNRRFNSRIDMSKDPTMYPFTKGKYVVELYYNARQAPAYIQDKFGYNGEGMTDKNFLRTDVREGQKVIFTSFELTKDQILQRGEWSNRPAVAKTKNYVEGNAVTPDDDIIIVPSIRSGGKT